MWEKFLVLIGLRLSDEEREFLNSIHKPEEIIVGYRWSLRRQKIKVNCSVSQEKGD